MNRHWVGVCFLLFGVTSAMTLLSTGFGFGVPVQALEITGMDGGLPDGTIAPMQSPVSITPMQSLTLSWRSAGRGLPGGRIGGAGR